jgi:aminopeptidase N
MTKETLLSDYIVPDFLVDDVTLDIDIRDDHARVTSLLEVRRNPKSKKRTAPLWLDGETQKLIGVTLNGHALKAKDYRLTEHGLEIPDMPNKATLEIVSTHDPYNNTSLSGLYAAGSMLCTQCESQGFRRISYYPDRPDVMASFRATLHADRKKFPILLANGNLIKKGKEGINRHFATWEDPFRKPCYLFAAVAGKFDKVSDHFKTKSGRKVLIEIYVEPGKTSETAFARTAIKNAMKWDEDTFGLEYDLDRFMMVATPFFNHGAMENKGLNVFNDVCVLGRTDTATDGTIEFIERVVGHEYFHNWTGDRITCRDWFQLSLKEGLTVFREQEFMGDMNSRAVERLDNIRTLRRVQFSEDSGAMSHAVRPDRYKAIDNFYTATIYEKGAELVRMIQTLAGRDGFKRGMKLYVQRHDGQAVTCDDFVDAMADANKLDLRQFMRWYEQAGTPTVTVKSEYNEKTKQLRLSLAQKTKPTPGQKKKKPLHIPFAVGLLDSKGRDMKPTVVLSLKKPKQNFIFKNVKQKPVLSLLRDFSAPVRLVYPQQTNEELLFLSGHDSDPFNRWEATYRLLTKRLLADVNSPSPASREREGPKPEGLGRVRAGDDKLIAALRDTLNNTKLDPAFRAMALALPSEGELGLSLRTDNKPIDPDALMAARKSFVLKIARALQNDLRKTHAKLASLSPKAADGVSMGKRSLKNLCLAYLAADENPATLKQVFAQATRSRNMTDTIAALGMLTDTSSPLRAKALKEFEKRWKKVPAVMDRWLAVQAAARRTDVLADVKKLLRHPGFDIKNPNRVSALIGAFAGNPRGFHAKNGSGYRFIAAMILKIDPINSHAAAGLAKAFSRWRDYEPTRQKLMHDVLKQLAKRKLSAQTMEVIERSLKN